MVIIGPHTSARMKNGKTRVGLYFTPAELKAAEAMAKKCGLRTANQWIISVVIKALILK